MDLLKLSTHILDTSIGKAAANVEVTLYHLTDDRQWIRQNVSATDPDGRCTQLLQAIPAPKGVYKLVYDVAGYFAARQVETLYPNVEIIIKCSSDQHYHIPLLLSPFGYSTYKGT